MRLKLSFFPSREFLVYWLPPLGFAALILILSGDLGSSKNTRGLLWWLLSWLPFIKWSHVVSINAVLRKTLHVAAYGFQYFLWFRAFFGQLGYRQGKSCLWSLGLCLLLAVVDEGHQFFRSTRTGSPWDVALNMAGSSLGAFITSLDWISRSGDRTKEGNPG